MKASRSVLVCPAAIAILFFASQALGRPAGFQGVGYLPGDGLYSEALGVSSDGSVVVGGSNSSDGYQAFRWQNGVISGLGILPDANWSSAAAVSSDGSVIVGGSGFYRNWSEAFLWQNGVMSGLGILADANWSDATAVSSDGSVVVGTCYAPNASYAFRWENGVMSGLGGPPGPNSLSEGIGVSSDGSIVVGRMCSSTAFCQAFRWANGQMSGLGALPAAYPWSEAYGVSADGTVVVGRSIRGNYGEAFRWRDGVMSGLGFLSGSCSGTGSWAYATSAKGSVVVGVCYCWGASDGQAFIWDESSGMRSIRDMLVNDFGLDLTGWTLNQVRGVSADGMTIVGTGTDPNGHTQGWIACIPRPVHNVTQDTWWLRIQDAIDAATSGDEIVLEPGLYRGDRNRDLDFKGKDITVRSKDPDDPNVVAGTLIDCQAYQYDSHRAFRFHSGEGANSMVAGLTIQNGYAPDETLPLIGSESVGGAILCMDSSPSIVRCTIRGNSAFIGGGVCSHNGSPTIANCRIMGNTASLAGGIAVFYGSPRIMNCAIIANSASHHGTSSGIGGGIGVALLSSPTIVNCTIVHNWAYSSGGGVYVCTNGQLAMSNCILWSNLAPQGPEISLEPFLSDFSNTTATVSYCDVESGQAGAYVAGGCSLTWGQGNADADPLFVNLNGPDGDPNTWQDNDYHLSSNSPCINAGDPNGVYAGQTDIDGEPRVVDGRVDIGSDEVSFHTLMLSVVHDNWGTVEIDPNRPAYPKGITVVLSAEPIQGKAFEGWAVWGDSTKYPDPNFITFKDANSVLYLTMNGSCLVEVTFKCGSGVGETLPLMLIGTAVCGFIASRFRRRR